MEEFPLGVTSAECEFYGDRLILLEGAIEEFLSCIHMIRRYQASLGRRDPIASFQARIKSAGSMKAKLERQNLPVTADSALREVWDAAGVRLICPFVENIDQTVELIHGGTFQPPDPHSDPTDFKFQVTPETPFEMRYFIVELTEQKEIQAVDLEHIAALDRQTVVDTVSRIVDAGTERGYVDHYRFGVFPTQAGGSTVIVLSTAKAIVTRHRGHISNRCAGGVITFTATIPQGS